MVHGWTPWISLGHSLYKTSSTTVAGYKFHGTPYLAACHITFTFTVLKKEILACVFLLTAFFLFDPFDALTFCSFLLFWLVRFLLLAVPILPICNNKRNTCLYINEIMHQISNLYNFKCLVHYLVHSTTCVEKTGSFALRALLCTGAKTLSKQ